MSYYPPCKEEKAVTKYTTGEAAKLCGVSVRTVQYYDSRNILSPSEISEGGRRLYSKSDIRRLKIICFLRDAGISINSIKELLEGANPEEVITTLVDEQEKTLKEEIKESQRKLSTLDGIRKVLKESDDFSVDSISDIAYISANRGKKRRLNATLMITGLPLNVFQWYGLFMVFVKKDPWPLIIWALALAVYMYWFAGFYFKQTACVCPRCHSIFRPRMTEFLFAKHTTKLRRVTCTCCGYHGFCYETYGKEVSDNV